MKLDFSQVSTFADPPTDAPAYEPVKPYDPLNLERAKKALAVYADRIKQLQKQIDAFVVDSDRAAAECTDIVARSAALIKTMEKSRKDTIADADGFVRSVNRFVKIYRDQMEAIVAAGKKKIGAWAYQKEQQRRADEAKAQKAAAQLQTEMNTAAQQGGFEPVKVPTMVIPRRTGPVRTESGSAATRMIWTWELVDGDKVPRDYLMIDARAIEAAIKAGLRKIPGIRIFEKPDVRIRTA